MFNSSPTTYSFGFGQSASAASPFGCQSGFGANTDLSNSNPFAPSGATPFAASTGATMFAGNSTTGAGAFSQPAISSTPFGSASVFGQTTGSYATATACVSASTGLATPSANSAGFGQWTNSSTYGSQSVFRQGSNSSNNNFFGTAATPFATSTGGSMFSGNSTGAFGASSFAFGSSASSTTAPFSTTFETSALPSTVFSQAPSSAPVVSQSAFGEVNKFDVNNSFSSKPVTATPFGSISGGAIFGGNSTSKSPFGVTSSPSTSKSPFGEPLPFSFGILSTTTRAPIFNNTGSLIQPSQSKSTNHAFYSSSQSVFGSSGVLASGTSTSVYSGFQHGGSCSRPPFSSTGLAFSSNGAPNNFNSVSRGAIGSSTTPITGAPSNFNTVASNNPELQNSRFTFCQPNSQFSEPNLQFGSNNGPTAWETKKFYSAYQPASTSMKSGQSVMDCQRYGSKIASSVATKEVDIGSTEPAGKLFSISAMPFYKDKSHEELRFEDSNQLLRSKDAASGFIFQSNQPSAGKTNAFLGPTAVTPHSQLKTSSAISIGSGPWTGNSTGFSYIGDQCRGSKIASYVATREVDIDSKEPPGKLFSISAMPIYKVKSHEELRFKDSHQFIGSKDAASGFIFQSNQPSAGKTNAFSGPTVVSLDSQPESLSAISTGTGLLTSNSSDFIWPNHEPITTPQITQIVVATDGASTSISQQSISTMDAGTCRQSGGMQQSESQSTIALDPSVVASPFGMESRIQMSMGGRAATTTVQYGISCIPVSDKPAPVKRNSLLTTRCLSLSQNWPSVEKYRPKNDSQKVPFYEEKVPGIYKVGASFIPRENARSWVLNSMVERPLKTNSRNSSLLEESVSASESGNFEADVEAILPKLQCPDYYIKPPVEELAAKERAEPGFCRRVKEFVVGREGYGSIRFLGETDVRNLDVESVIQLNHREVIVYRDTTKKPQVGQGLNKPAEVSLLNVKCINKRTGKQYVEGTRVDKWTDMLKTKAEEQGAEFLSYNPVTGEWKFRVQHF
ncbi:nuclear pore complex protein NUP98A isoform X1 [Coffea arabica]|uniref:Nuclear pore complex protein NUP98A isoform X1 n=2 Tax=Coffea arabica TaxID=13443 RepID=A0A6P6W0H7_COFAR|nr:nuclear pore complex protein NUP98A-like isoform X2 [Coffea arabica]XP_027114986.1 nuclear pore complex protein NUP98A-like isoform X1 [Coffea arabica]